MNMDNKNMKKPKRPLSGYNLFYRYKRNKVLEATAAAAAAASNTANADASQEDEDARTRTIIASLPGLESIPPTHPLYSLPSEAINTIRGQNIRREMEGKIFPNENARSRLHRKVHGMGFVEMGKLMREQWACVDEYTKEVFAELADVGRVRYRRLLAEFKLVENGALNSEAAEAGTGVEVKVVAVATAPPAEASKTQAQSQAQQQTKTRNSFSQDKNMMLALSAEQISKKQRNSFSQDMMMVPEVTPKPADKPKFQPGATLFASPTFRRVTMSTMPVAAQTPTVSSISSIQSSIQPSSSIVGISQMIQTRPATQPVVGSLGMFEPLSVSTNFAGSGPSNKKAKYNRRVSNDSICGEFNLQSGTSTPMIVNNNHCSTPVFSNNDMASMSGMTASSGSSTRLSSLIQAHSQVANKYQALLLSKNLLKNCLPPPPLFQSSMANNSNSMSNGTTEMKRSLIDEIIPSAVSSMSCNDQVPVTNQVSAEDYIELLDSISDDALENNQEKDIKNRNDVMNGMLQEKKQQVRRPSVIFGKPMHDIEQQKMMSGMNPMPMSGMELNNSRARMA